MIWKGAAAGEAAQFGERFPETMPDIVQKRHIPLQRQSVALGLRPHKSLKVSFLDDPDRLAQGNHLLRLQVLRASILTRQL
jgi:hypothetical protein